MVINFPEDHIAQNIDTVVPVLVEMLSSVPLVDFDQSLSWQGARRTPTQRSACILIHILSDWALPDQLVFSTVSALLRITSVHTEYSETAVNAIFAFIAKVIENIQTANCELFPNSPQKQSLKQFTSGQYSDPILPCIAWFVPGHNIHNIPLVL